MNQVTPEQKDSVTKTFAIVGFVVAILFAVWLAVQVVSVIPSAFNSLASIADGVYNYNEDQELTVSTPTSVVNSREAFEISWTEMTRPGTYSFEYECVDGVAIDARDVSGNIISLDCGTPMNLLTETELELLVLSEKQRFVDISYTVTFTPKAKGAVPTLSNSQITIVNASIPTQTEIVIEPEMSEEPEEVVVEEPTPTVAGETTTETPVTNTPSGDTGLTAGTPTTVEEIIYAIPTSNPNGKIDLQVTYLGVGSLEDKTFTREAELETDKQGAFKFEVRNIGTKTSHDWEFEAHLPSGIEYQSKSQDPLKPNEKAVITIGFNGLTQTGVERFGADITTKDDVNRNNNSFTWAVKVVN